MTSEMLFPFGVPLLLPLRSLHPSDACMFEKNFVKRWRNVMDVRLKLLLTPTRLDLEEELKALGRWQRKIEGAETPNGFTTFTKQGMAQQPVKLWSYTWRAQLPPSFFKR